MGSGSHPTQRKVKLNYAFKISQAGWSGHPPATIDVTRVMSLVESPVRFADLRPFNNFFKHSVPAVVSGTGQRISVILFANEHFG